VVLKEADYRDLQARARPVRMVRKASAQDRADIAVALRRRGEPERPYAELRSELGQ
jgi:hypothetical protein